MYKLVAIGGKIRGTEFVLNEGDNIIGRAAECDHVITADGVSKKHMRITVNGQSAFIEDLGSSNGTFVNDKLTRKMTVKDGDKITLPNVIFQLFTPFLSDTQDLNRLHETGAPGDTHYTLCDNALRDVAIPLHITI